MSEEAYPEASFAQIEEEVQRFWRRHQVTAALRAAGRDSQDYAIYQQPLSAVGQRWADQVQLLATADLFARYRAMRGSIVHHQVGWVCHGQQVEVAVERSLGWDTSGYDLAEFNAACRGAVIDGLHQGEALMERMALVSDPSSVYTTMTPQAIGTVWGALRQLWDATRLRHEQQVVPVCPRCDTALSAAEAMRRSVEVPARAIWLHLPWDGEPNAYFLAWTAMPWTLIGMVALAVHPDSKYVLVELASDQDDPPMQLLMAETALDNIPVGEFRVIRWVRGRSLRDARYRPAFAFLPVGQGIDHVVLSRDVPLDRGTGLLPVTPAFDSLSLSLAQEFDLPVPQLLDDRGYLEDAVTHWRGLSPLEAEPLLIENLRARGLSFQEEATTLQRALCPHCETALLSLARPVWLVEADSGPWIVGRARPWGVPLPVWICEQCGKELCVAGLDDLAHRTGLDVDRIDLHRPAIDHVSLYCESCGGTARRVADVVDAAFEAAVASLHSATQIRATDRAAGPSTTDHRLPRGRLAQLSRTQPEGRPRQSLAVAQADGQGTWLGDFAEVAALLTGSAAWRHAVVLPENGADAAWDPERRLPADALRWAVHTGTTPEQAESDFLGPLWRLTADLTAAPTDTALPRRTIGRDLFDQWLMARLHQTIGKVTGALNACQPQEAARAFAALVSDFVEWYAPHRPGDGIEVLTTIARLLAPFSPHLAEAIHRRIHKATLDSVHLSAWPAVDPEKRDPELLDRMVQLRRLTSLGQVARNQAGIAPDRMLHQAIIGHVGRDEPGLPELTAFVEPLPALLRVSEVQFTKDAAEHVTWRFDLKAGQMVERGTTRTEIEAALELLDSETAATLAAQLWQGLTASLQVDEEAITLLPDEITISAQTGPDWTAAADARYLVILEVG
jgi:isoleucyl-tRNA synthetase